jgi:hypothetical protein
LRGRFIVHGGRSGALHCFNSNNDDNGSQVFAFHDASRCVAPDLNHSWFPTHQEANYANPNNTLGQSLNNGFVLVNDQTEQIDNGVESPTDDQTMGFPIRLTSRFIAI